MSIRHLISLAAGRPATVWRAYGPQNAWGSQETTLHLSYDENPPEGVVSHVWQNPYQISITPRHEEPTLVGRITADGKYQEVGP